MNLIRFCETQIDRLRAELVRIDQDKPVGYRETRRRLFDELARCERVLRDETARTSRMTAC